jgi:hypothetical protein
MQFQFEAIEVNVITPLITFNSKFKQYKKEVDDIDLEDSTLEIM